MAQLEDIRIEHDRELDLLTAYLNEDSENQLDVLEGPFDGHVLFYVDSVTKKLARIEIYDFSIIQRMLLRRFIFLLTKETIKSWLATLIDSFRANPNHQERFAH